MPSMSSHVFGADLETDNDGTRAWMVQYAISDSEKEVHGTTWESFLNRCANLMKEDSDSYLYFHNLNYDGNFLKYPLKEFCDENNYEMFIIKRQASLINIQIIPPEDSKLSTLHFRDSSKKLAQNPPLYQVAKLVGLEKLDGFDFHPGWSYEVNFGEASNWNYVHMDARIVAKAMRQLHDMGMRKPTISGDAWQRVKASIGFRTFKQYYPSLEYETDSFLRNAYSGGINISEHHGLNKGPITHADVHSMYPSVMMYDPLPFDKPFITDEEPDSLYVVRGLFRLNLRPDFIPWFQFKRSVDATLEGMDLGTPVRHNKNWHLLTLTNVELELLRKWYYVETAYDDPDNPAVFYGFRSVIGAFEPHIREYIKLKQQSRKGSLEYVTNKAMMNHPYGRFGLNPDTEATTLEWDGDKLVWKQTKVVMENHDAYLPVAEFVTANAKRRLLDYVYKVGMDRVIHCDTDSVIHKGHIVPGIDYGDELGQWGIESEPIQMWEGGFKRYIEMLTDDYCWTDKNKWLAMACAGVPNKLTPKGLPYGMWIELLDDPETILSDKQLGQKEYKIHSKWLRKLYKNNGMNPDRVNTMKLIPKAVPGGVILEERNHKLCDPYVFRWKH